MRGPQATGFLCSSNTDPSHPPGGGNTPPLKNASHRPVPREATGHFLSTTPGVSFSSFLSLSFRLSMSLAGTELEGDPR